MMNNENLIPCFNVAIYIELFDEIANISHLLLLTIYFY